MHVLHRSVEPTTISSHSRTELWTETFAPFATRPSQLIIRQNRIFMSLIDIVDCCRYVRFVQPFALSTHGLFGVGIIYYEDQRFFIDE